MTMDGRPTYLENPSKRFVGQFFLSNKNSFLFSIHFSDWMKEKKQRRLTTLFKYKPKDNWF
jgi:hypothetical protein